MKWWPKILLVIGSVATGSAICVWYACSYMAVSQSLERGVRQIVVVHPTLQQQFERATADGILSMSEANAIIHAAEKLKASAP